MPDLIHSLLKQDIGHLRIVAGLWGCELDSTDLDLAREELAASLLDPKLVHEILETLSPSINAALDALITKDGRIPWAEFTRQFGNIREMGAGRRDRERPHLKPASSAEALFYRGLLARAFFDTPNGAQEFAYIPDDLLALIDRGEHSPSLPTGQGETKKENHVNSEVKPEPLGRPASPGERGQDILATDHILDDATTLLAALRLGVMPPETNIPIKVIQDLLALAGLINKKGVPQPERIKKFLESPRDEALRLLTDAWLESDKFNELRQLPGLVFEGEWHNQSQVTREFLLNLLEAIPDGKWWSLNAFIRSVKDRYPDFQRPAGDYDSWFIKRESDGQYLRGFAYWDEVDGALIRYFITKVLHWLGQVDLSFAEGRSVPTAFQIAGVENRELGIGARGTNNDSRFPNIENGKLHISSNGKITAPRLVSRTVRYQLSRFCEWDEEKADEYRYHVTPRSLSRAKEQGLKVEHLLVLLARHADAGIPPVFVKALKRWEVNGTEARVEPQVVLRVSRPEVLEEMRKSKAAKYLGEILGPTTVVVKSGAIQKVMEALTELGLLMDNAQAAVPGGEIASSGRTPSSQ